MTGLPAMSCTLIVLAHPDRNSFNGQWAEATARICKAQGNRVIWSDLHAMHFDPAERREHYPGMAFEGSFDVLKAQEKATATGELPADVVGEIDKIQSADRIIFHFPLWWFSPPAILKGWCERVLANGAMHNADDRFDRGLFTGRKILFCVTTGSKASESSHDGKEGDVKLLLWPFAYTLRYLGFTVLEHRIVHGVHGYHKGRARQELKSRLRAELKNHEHTITNLEARKALPFNADTDFDENGSLLPTAASHSHFIRHHS